MYTYNYNTISHPNTCDHESKFMSKNSWECSFIPINVSEWLNESLCYFVSYWSWVVWPSLVYRSSKIPFSLLNFVNIFYIPFLYSIILSYINHKKLKIEFILLIIFSLNIYSHRLKKQPMSIWGRRKPPITKLSKQY